jgi:hypothetical protein
METMSRTKLKLSLAKAVWSSRFHLRDDRDDERISDACNFEEVLCRRSVTCYMKAGGHHLR